MNSHEEEPEIPDENDQNKTLDSVNVKKIMERIKILLIMRQLKDDNTPVEIIPNLFIGCLGAALNKKKLQELQIKHIISACEMPQPPENGGIQHIVINVNDSIHQDIISKFEISNAFLRAAIERQENALVHCFAGKSRSTSFIIAYLIKYHRMTPAEGLEAVQAKRQIAQPNSGFMSQLESYYQKLYPKQQEDM